MVQEMFFGGSDTTSSTIEWAMAELLCNPNSMRKVKEEINSVVGLYGKVEEKNIDQLPYLQAVVKENLRLHPGLHFHYFYHGMQCTILATWGIKYPRIHKCL